MIRKRGRAYQVRIPYGHDAATGTRVERYVGTYRTKKEAETAETNALYERDHGLAANPERLTVGELLTQWLTTVAEPSVAPLTYRRYNGIAARWSQLLGSVRLKDLRVGHVQAAVRKMHEDTLAPRTIGHHLRLLKQVMKQAIRWQFASINPVEGVKAPRPAPLNIQAVRAEDFDRLLSVFEGSDRRLVHVALSTGMRRGELLGLAWNAVDLDAGALEVRRTLQWSKDRGLYFREAPKTSHSRRRIGLGPETVATLHQQKAEQLERRLQLGDGYNLDNLVFPDAVGGPERPDHITERFIRRARGAGFERLRFHDLRHTMATVMLASGVPVKVVSERLGHASAGFTLNTYGHVIPGMDDDAAAAFDALIRNAGRRAG